MNKIKNIKNRLSLSVDKLSPARSKSPPTGRRSCHYSPSPLPVEDSSPVSRSPKRPRRDKSRASRSSSGCRPASFKESPSTGDLEERKRVTSMEGKSGIEAPMQQSKEADGNESESHNQSFDSFQGFSKSLSENDPPSLMEEVMKEVQKISTITESIKNNSSTQGETESESAKTLLTKSYTKESKSVSTKDEAIASTSSNTSLVQDKVHCSRSKERRAIDSTCTTHSTASTLHAESLTSGYFSDSASEDTGSCDLKKRQVRSKTASPIQKMFKFSKQSKNEEDESRSEAPVLIDDKKETSKKESIYSRLIKSTKRDSSTARTTKEPIYARIKPKLKLETSFKPIEPIVPKEASTESKLLVKPEPIYTTSKSKESSHSESQIASSSPVVSISSGSPSSPFTPIPPLSPEKELSKEPIYSSIKPKKEKTRTLPLEALYSKIRRKDTHTLPKETSPPAKEPIYNQPLPALPIDAEIHEKDTSKHEPLSCSTSDSSYGKMVTVKEIPPVSPSKPSVITISNPGYAKIFSSTSSPTSSPPVSPRAKSPPKSPTQSPTQSPPQSPMDSLPQSPFQSPPLSPLHSPPRTPDPTSSGVASSAKECSTEYLEKSMSMDNIRDKDDLDLSQSTLGIDEEIRINLGSSSKLSRLVEELAQELETVTQNTGTGHTTNPQSKREVLTRLLATYDVPKNLRRVEEADENDVLTAEKSLLTSASSGDELRYMDDDENMETIYADVPDYSQDEFVIALDDENDPKYASLTRGMRRKSRGGESPGKVSRKSAQVYVNVVNVISALKVLINSNSTKAATVINRMGTLARPYAHKVHSSLSDNSTWIQRKIQHKSGHNGFDELRKYIKSGGEFCKELAIIMHERAELEASYAKGLHKLSTKLIKASRDSIGTISEAWQAVGAELEHEGDVHRILAAALTEDVVRPLRQMIETQHKIRKGVEGLVDKATKNLQEWKQAETKSKKNSHHNTRENEKVQDMMIEARLGRGKNLSEKEMIKLEKQRRKAEEAVQKSDIEYYNFCIRTERARQEWESAVYKGSNCFQTLEEERLSSLKDLVLKYHSTNKEAAPKLVACAARLDEPVSLCDVEKDIQTVIIAKGTGENVPEQCLPDFYSEDLNNAMNKVRRREALEKFSKLIKMDLDRERKGKQGVENLAKALQETPNFGGEDSQQDVNDKLQNMKAMLAYLEASRYKVQAALDEVNNRPPCSHPLAKHIQMHRDKQGLPVSILKVPPWVKGNSTDVSPLSESPTTGSPNWNDRGTADGNSVQPDSDFASAPINPESDRRIPNDSVLPSVAHPQKDSVTSSVPRAFMFPARYPSLILPTDEFSSQGSDHDYQCAVTEIGSQERQKIVPKEAPTSHGILQTPDDQLDSGTGSSPPDGTYYARPLTTSGVTMGRCKALYDYEANLYDELSIHTGDIITIHEKQPDGWWVGEVEGNLGIFPATYVEEID